MIFNDSMIHFILCATQTASALKRRFVEVPFGFDVPVVAERYGRWETPTLLCYQIVW